VDRVPLCKKKPPQIVDMNGTDTFLDINNAHLRVNSGNVQASTFVLDQINIVTSANTATTVNFNNVTKAFNAASNIEVGTANLFVDTTTSNVGIGTNAPLDTLHINGGTLIGGHILPTQHEQFDIGSASAKIRHLFLSDNSLWLGDETRISFTGGKMKFRRRKKNILPRGLLTIGAAAGHANEVATRTAALAHAGKSDITDMKLENWLGYAKTLDATKDISDVFTEEAADYEATAASEAFSEVGDDIFSSHNVAIGKTTAPNYALDVVGDINFTGTLRKGGTEYGSGTGALTVPSGTTAQRPATPVNGMIRYNSVTGFMEAYTAQGWGIITQPPSVSGISPSTVLLTNTGTQVFTITGGGFTSGSTVKLVGADGTEYTVFDTTIVGATQITFKMGVDGATDGYDKAQRPYTFKVTSGSGLATRSSATIGLDGLSWTSPAGNATLNYVVGTSSTQTLVATDDINGSDVTFSIVSGTLNGLTLASATASPATFGGSATGVDTNSVVFRITDNVSGATLDRTFSINVTVPTNLYTFTTHTFTHCSGDTRYGPQLSNALSTYGNISPWNNTNLFNITTRGFQLWKVPKTGTYRITAYGAKGGQESTSAGSYNNTPGNGAYVRADIALTLNTQVVFIVGQKPPQSTGNYRSGSGGGATWVLKSGTYTNNADVYMVAGGGGGAGPRHFNAGTSGSANGSSQGTLGGGGTTHWNYNGGGAGWTADGSPAPPQTRGGKSPANGAMGGSGTTHGGFGGGGSESGDSAAGGAGATGGRAALRYNSTGSNTARGGTSYITTTATNRTFLGNHSTDNGSVVVEFLS